MQENIHFIDSDWSVFTDLISLKKYSKIFVLVDTNTMNYCLPIFNPILNQEFEVIEVEPGEKSKDLEICAHIWSELSDQNVDRKSVIINLGGGVVSDLGSFVASIYKRGINVINIPTSLLSMVDASIGAKCGIDFIGFKNQLGSFKCVEGIFINAKFLETLPQVELISGLAEMLKHGLISNREHWNKLISLKSISFQNLAPLINQSTKIKNRIVEKDPFEENIRKTLNFGHTIGHAIESFLLQKGVEIKHGFAIAAGMICEVFISRKHELISAEEFIMVERGIDKFFTRIELAKTEFPLILGYMHQDKKNDSGIKKLSLINEIGSCLIDQEIDDQLILDSLAYYIGELR